MIVAFGPTARERIVAACRVRGLATAAFTLGEALASLASGESLAWAVLAAAEAWRDDATAAQAHDLAGACHRLGLPCAAAAEEDALDAAALDSILDRAIDVAAGARAGT